MYNVRKLQGSECDQLRDIGDFIYLNHPDKNLSFDDVDYILNLLVDLDKKPNDVLEEEYQKGYDDGFDDGYYEGLGDN